MSDLREEKYVRPRLVRKNTSAMIPVARLRKFAEPVAPKTLPERAAAERCTDVGAFAVLKQDETDDRKRCEHVDDQYENFH